ncbi:MAG: SDR family oxidoreductase [Tannerella sp.]|jgi:NAD(P)-dependent dehydrogenase (short-subunit alcohol dehydrogenase family)|nr:SDR family oxidoreductase [Tannerella sp.]
MENLLFSVKDKVIILTGGSGILGSSMAKHLANEKAKVVILDRNAETGKNLEEEIKKDGGVALFLETDVLNKDVLVQNRKDILDAFGTIDVLINLAGGNMAGATIPPEKTFFDLDVDAFRKVVDLNLFGTVLPTMVFAKVMADNRKGCIINISSESALRPLTRVVGYGCAKAAISNFTQYMAGELATKFGEGLRVNAIAPGFFLTEQNRALMSNPDGSPTERCKSVTAHTPFRRLGRPDELLGTVQWLASEASAFVTGTIIPIDGGFDAFSI